ncbi:MAG: sugar phosphate nucleotidyltransferase [Chthoniobacterales bacterium]
MSNTHTPRTLLVLAAGMGSRYGGLKQIDPMGPSGETILDYSIHDARKAGFNKVVFVIRRWFDDQFREAVGNRYEKLLKVDYVYQELDDLPAGFKCPEGREKPWGTGHAILMGESAIKEPFAVINADDFYGNDAFRELSDFLGNAASSKAEGYALVGYILRNTLSDHGTVSRGVCTVSSEGYLKDIKEMTSIRRERDGAVSEEADKQPLALTGDELVSLNLWGFTPGIFPHLRTLFTQFLEERGQEMKSEFFIPFAVDELIASKKAEVKVLQTTSSWLGITYREDKPLVQEALAKMTAAGDYPASLF